MNQQSNPKPIEWVTVPCTNPSCRGRRYDHKGAILEKGFDTQVKKGEESRAICNECFCR